MSQEFTIVRCCVNTSVPMAIVGALIPLFFGVATMNIYTKVGLLTLIGLITKHGILMVEFANELQLNEGLDKRSAIEMAARIRLRPILMTTAAMVRRYSCLSEETGPVSETKPWQISSSVTPRRIAHGLKRWRKR